MAKLMHSSIKLNHTKLKTRVSRFLKHISPDKRKAHKDSFGQIHYYSKLSLPKLVTRVLHTVPDILYGDLGRQHVDVPPLKMER
jgi:hypothetical protein